jgi:hypothetical protein
VEEREEELFAVRIDLGSPSGSVVGTEEVARSRAVETGIQLAVAHNPFVVREIQKHWAILSAEMPKKRGVVRENQLAGEGSPRQIRVATGD